MSSFFFFLTDEDDRSASDSDDCIIPDPTSKNVKQVGSLMPTRNGLK
jgi:hypothetical protein